MINVEDIVKQFSIDWYMTYDSDIHEIVIHKNKFHELLETINPTDYDICNVGLSSLDEHYIVQFH